MLTGGVPGDAEDSAPKAGEGYSGLDEDPISSDSEEAPTAVSKHASMEEVCRVFLLCVGCCFVQGVLLCVGCCCV